MENFAIALATTPFILVAVLLLGALLFGIFTIWMFVHNLVRCFKRTDETVKNVALLLLQFFVFFVGPLVYYFVCYRGDNLLGAKSAPA